MEILVIFQIFSGPEITFLKWGYMKGKQIYSNFAMF